MRKPLILAVTAGAAVAAMLVPAAASAATYGVTTLTSASATPKQNATPDPTTGPSSAAANTLSTAPAAAASAGSDPDTTVTFDVTSGLLTMTAPATASLGSGSPGTTISGAIGSVVVTDNRALLSGTWTAVASSTDFITGAGSPAETIPATDATYDPGVPFVTGSFVATPTTITLSATPQTVVSSTGNGDNTATWNPTIGVAVPATAVTGHYTATLTQSVS